MTDLSEHTAEFYLLNFSDSTLSIDFVSNQKKSVLTKSSIKNLAPINENDSLVNTSWNDIFEIKDNPKIGYIASTFIPGTYKVDIDGFAQAENIYPIVTNEGQTIPIKNEKEAYMVLRYNINPSQIFLIIKSRLKLSIDSEVYKQICSAYSDNDDVIEALNTLYYQNSFPQGCPAKIRNTYAGSSPADFISKIRLLEQNTELVDNQAEYFIF